MLQSGGGGPRPPRPDTGGRNGRRAGFIAGGSLLGVGVLAAGAWAGYSMLFATGEQPAEALPESTVAYVSVDLDPSGRQKLAALDTLEKFPAFADNVDLAADDDLRALFFDEVQGDGVCPDLDFADDIDPWLGDRFGVAAIDLGAGSESASTGLGVTGVGVVQVDDAARAEEGLAELRSCGGEGESFGWSVVGDWAVIAESTEIAEQVTADAAEASLSDDDDFARWIDEAGDPGILTAYVAPEAGTLLADAVGSLGSLGGLGAFGGLGGPSAFDCLPDLGDDPFAEDPFAEDPFGDDPFGDDPFAECEDSFAPESGLDDLSSQLTDDLTEAFEGFEGAAMTVRFADGGLEIETATGSSLGLDGEEAMVSDAGDDAVVTLPETTAVAFGIGLPDGWFDGIRASVDDVLGGEVDSFLDLAEEQTGLQLPEDLETLLGDSTALALGGDVDLASFDEPEPPSDLELGVKVLGDTDGIAGVIDRITASADDSTLDTLLGYASDDDFVTFGPSEDYRAALLEDGGLGDTEVYRDAVLNSEDAGLVVFVNFDAGSWLTSIPGLPDDVRRNLEPLSALGLSSWSDDGVSHGALRISTD